MSEWQPIETAPEDMELLLYQSDFKWYCVAFAGDELDIFTCAVSRKSFPATHWMHLPSPPEIADLEAGGE